MRRLVVSLAGLVIVAAAAFSVVRYGPAMIESTRAQAETPTPSPKPVPTSAKSALVAQAEPAPGAPSATTTTTTTTTNHGGWTVTCNEGGNPPSKICSANFRVFDQKTKVNLLVWLLGRNAEGVLLSEFVTFTEVRLEPGVVVTLDEGKPVRAGFVECGKNSCKARLELTPQMARQFKAAKKARLDVTRLDGKVIQFTMDIPGIDAALGDLGA